VVSVTGTLQSAGTASGYGGSVKVLGDKVGLFNALGWMLLERLVAAPYGRGNSREGPDRMTSETIVAKNATITADATTSGDGGRVVVWSNEHTQFSGRSARVVVPKRATAALPKCRVKAAWITEARPICARRKARRVRCCSIRWDLEIRGGTGRRRYQRKQRQLRWRRHQRDDLRGRCHLGGVPE